MTAAEQFALALGCLRDEELSAAQAAHRVRSLLDAVAFSARLDLGHILVQVAAVALAGAQTAERTALERLP